VTQSTRPSDFAVVDAQFQNALILKIEVKLSNTS
jgi:hypothetical protein